MENPEIFKIDEITLLEGKCYCIFGLSENIFGNANWKLYDNDINNGHLLTYEQAEQWLTDYIKEN